MPKPVILLICDVLSISVEEQPLVRVSGNDITIAKKTALTFLKGRQQVANDMER